MKVPDELVALIKRERLFTIASHVSPEPDALGSSISLALALESMGKKAYVFNRDGVADMFRFLPRSEMIRREIENEDLKDSVLLILDCSGPDRVGLDSLDFKYVAVIDHHKTAGDFGQINWIEPESPATGLMIFNLLKKLGVEIDHEMAVNLYTAIAVDTGTFRYNNTTPESLRAAAELIESYGVNPAFVSYKLYKSWSVNRFNLLVAMLDTIEYFPLEEEMMIAVSHITQKMFDETGTDAADTEDFVDFVRMIQKVVISAMFREIEPGYWKASLRSKGSIDVAAVASSFGGGGHTNAAGYKVYGSLDDVKRGLVEAVRSLQSS
jgi:phosphoesterase RecJ-like protein